jgi:hypothetical protein
MTRAGVRAIPVGIVAVAAILAACSSSKTTGPKLTPQALVGAYYLDTLSSAGQTLTPPAINGSLVLTDNGYKEHVLLVTGTAPSDTTQLSSDSGTYSISGSTFTQTSQVPGGVNVTATAALRGNGDTLDVAVTSPAAAAGTYVWVRQP